MTMVVEYYNAALDHYFVTVAPQEMAALDSGRISGWTRTGYAFWAYDAPPPSAKALPVCRFYIPPRSGDSHFLSASPAECAAVADLVRTDPALCGLRARVGECVLHSAARRRERRVRRNRATGLSIVERPRRLEPPLHGRCRRARGACSRSATCAEGYGSDGVAMCAP